MSIGRRWLEKLLNASGEAIHARARREEVCGHRQRLVGIREKTVLTVMGKVTIRRPYYQCMKEKNEEKEQETAKGMHLGSGIAEAACKTVVSTRAKRSGMRWTPQGLDAILALRTTVLNKTYKTFWQPRQHLIA
jgi:hypothetical protein